jgi:ABC-type sugar transport system ATPase subunit
MNDDLLLRVDQVSKSFPGVLALQSVSFSLKRGSVHALCGENGAGKSTLMKILIGLYRRDSGEIFLRGEKVDFSLPKQALHAGISIIEQELTPIYHMTVAENLFLGREPRKSGIFIDYRVLNRKAKLLLAELDITIPPTKKMKELSLGEIQLVEIAKALSYDSDVIIMDEPTSAIGEREVGKLFEIIELLKSKGKGIVYVSHRMREVFEIADEVTVLRDGRYISTENIEKIDSTFLVSLMIGKRLEDDFHREQVKTNENLLTTRGFSRNGVFSELDITLKKGEVLGIFGLMGSGRTEFFHSLFGIEDFDSGEICIEGSPVSIRSPKAAIGLGLALVSEDRKNEGLVITSSVKDNIVLSSLESLSTGVFLNSRREKETANDMIVKMNVKTSSSSQLVKNLSGGNQQKVVLARCLLTKPRILLLDEPTRGIDVAAKWEIYKIIADYAKLGNGVILVSSEIPEITRLSDRIIVFKNGRIVEQFDKKQYSHDKLLHAAS